MVDPSIVKNVSEYLKALHKEGIRVLFGVIFGSYATGRADRWSDIDVLVVSPRFDGLRNRRDIDLLWRMAAKLDSRIEPFPCGEKQWKDDVSSTLVEIARREGERVRFEEYS
jgi:predicted nucleotidyltransferase